MQKCKTFRWFSMFHNVNLLNMRRRQPYHTIAFSSPSQPCKCSCPQSQHHLQPSSNHHHQSCRAQGVHPRTAKNHRLLPLTTLAHSDEDASNRVSSEVLASIILSQVSSSSIHKLSSHLKPFLTFFWRVWRHGDLKTRVDGGGGFFL